MDQTEPTPTISFDNLQAPTEALLSQALGRPITIARATLLTEAERRNQVWRCSLANAGEGEPQTVILKRADPQEYQPDNLESRSTQGFLRDWVGAAFLSEVCGAQRHGPQFYGGNLELGFVLLEDMGEHRSLVQPLLEGNASEATAALIAYAARLGRMHADTIGHQDDFRKMIHAVNPAAMPWLDHSEAEARKHWQEMLAQVVRLLVEVNIHLSDAALDEVEQAFMNIQIPGPFTAFIHTDPCPDNVFYANGQLRLIDFEFSRFGHALVDGLYGRFPFPTCWCANEVPGDVVAQMETRYRAELSRTCAAADDDALFGAASIAVCTWWTLMTLADHLDNALKEPNAVWGIATIRARVLSRLGMFVRVAVEHGQHSALAEAMHATRSTLTERWSWAAPLPLYPAFR